MLIAVRVDTNDVVQLICNHPDRPPAQLLGDTLRCRSGDETAGGTTVTGHTPTRADRLLIRPASGRQTGTGHSARTHHWKDTATAGHSEIESQTKSTDATLATTPDGVPHTHSSGMSPEAAAGRTPANKRGSPCERSSADFGRAAPGAVGAEEAAMSREDWRGTCRCRAETRPE